MTAYSGNISQFMVGKNIWSRVEIELRVTKSTPECETLPLQAFYSKVSYIEKRTFMVLAVLRRSCNFSMEYHWNTVLKYTHTYKNLFLGRGIHFTSSFWRFLAVRLTFAFSGSPCGWALSPFNHVPLGKKHLQTWSMEIQLQYNTSSRGCEVQSGVKTNSNK